MGKNYEVLYEPPPIRVPNESLDRANLSPQYPIPNSTKTVGQSPSKIPSEMRDQIFKGIPAMFHEFIENSFTNGLGGALGYPGAGGQGWPGNPFSETISDTRTLFKNLRWFFVSNYRQLLSELYVEIGLIGTIIDVPVDDALRGGIQIKSKQLDESEIDDLQISIDQDDDLNTVAMAAKWNRLFGGAGILVMTDQDPYYPLDLKLIDADSPLEFRAVDMWELFWSQQSTVEYAADLQEEIFSHYNYYELNLHKSRVMKMKNKEAPSFLRPRLRGWGFSEVERLVRSVNQYLKGTDLAFEVLDEFKLDVYKFKNLGTMLYSPQGEQRIKQRVREMQYYKNYQNAIVLDKEDEFDHKQLSFSGLGEAMEGIRMQVASDMRIPIVKLFGSQSSKLGGKDDETELEVYNCMVESEVRNKIKYDILRILKIKSQKLFGRIPTDLSITFKPLRVLNAVDEETVKSSKTTRFLAMKQAGELTTLEFREIVNKDELVPIKLDTKQEELNPDDPEIAAVVAGEDTTRKRDDEGVDDPAGENDSNE